MNLYPVNQFWADCKAAAASSPEGLLSGLAKIAIALWDGETTGEKNAESLPQAHREAFAASFAGAALVDLAIEKMAADGFINDLEYQQLSTLNAQAAFSDVQHLTKVAAPQLSWRALLDAANNSAANAILNHRLHIQGSPTYYGATRGALLGAAIGAYADDDDRLRGAAMGGLGGLGLGAIGAQALKDSFISGNLASLSAAVQKKLGPAGHGTPGGPLPTVSPPGETLSTLLGPHVPDIVKNPWAQAGAAATTVAGTLGLREYLKRKAAKKDTEEEPKAAEEILPPEDGAQEAQAEMAKQQQTMSAAATTVDNLAFMANQVQLPTMAQEIQATRDQLIQYFAAGNNTLPPSLQKYFPESAQVAQFMEKYRQRFAPLPVGKK